MTRLPKSVLKKKYPQLKAPRPTKYANKKIEHAGYSFASKGEAALFDFLKLRERAGEIKVLQNQDHVYLTEARILYIPDFKCQDLISGEVFWAEFKGFSDKKWPIKRRLWLAGYGPGKLEIYKANYRDGLIQIRLVETLIPKPLPL